MQDPRAKPRSGTPGDPELAELLARVAGRSARALIERGEPVDLWNWSRSSAGELASELALDRRTASRLAAALELARRMVERSRAPRTALRSADEVHHVMEPIVRGEERERFFVLALDGKHRLKRVELVSLGTLSTSLVHPREVFRPALRCAAAAVIAVHNHPSGDPEPSPEDFDVTRRLLQAGRLLGVPLLDHVVIGEARFVSLAERLGLARDGPSQPAVSAAADEA